MNYDDYENRKMIKLVVSEKVDIKERVKTFENEKFKRLYPQLKELLNFNCGYVENPHSKYCNTPVFYRKFDVDNEKLINVIDLIINEFNLKVIDNFKGYESESIRDILYQIHNDNLHHYGIYSFTDAIPLRYINSDYEKTYKTLHNLGIYYQLRLLDEILS